MYNYRHQVQVSLAGHLLQIWSIPLQQHLLWTSTPASSFNDPTLQNPMALPTETTNYQVLARIGSCTATENIVVRAVPYPVADAGVDTVICYNTAAFLKGSHDGSSFTWSPVSSLINANTLNPTAYPLNTTTYMITSFDTRGCPKPGYDTVLVTALPKIHPFTGNHH